MASCYRNGKFAEAVGGLRFYGRMSLTNYIAQSVLGAFVYFPFGLYLAPHCGYTASLAIGLLIFLLQMRFCCKNGCCVLEKLQIGKLVILMKIKFWILLTLHC